MAVTSRDARVAGAPAAPAASPKPRESWRWTRAALVALPAAVVWAWVDSVGTGWSSAAGTGERLRIAALLFVYVLPFFVVGALVVSGLWSLGSRIRDWAAAHGLKRYDAGIAREMFAAALPGLALAVALIFVAALVTSKRFNNRELAALLVAVVALAAMGAGTLASVTAFAGFGAIRRRFASSPRVGGGLVWILAASGPMAVAIWLTWVNWSGFSILGPWFFAAPALASIAALIARLSGHRSRWSERAWLRRTAWMLPLMTAALAFLVARIAPDTPNAVSQGGIWSKLLLTGARAATDFDRDGSSSFFGGGDCAPFDRRIHPRARDIPGDGIDQNCFNGDARPSSSDQPPQWHDDVPGAGRAKNLVVITIEALRSDHVGAYGYARPTTPQMDALAKRSVLFTRMYSASSATIISIPAIWSARPPTYIKLQKNAVHPSVTWIPEVLKQAGWVTAAFLPSYIGFQKEGWNLGFDRGFETYDTTTPVVTKGGFFHGFPSPELAEKTNGFIDQHATKRFLLWTHFVEPHATFDRPPGAPSFGDKDVDRYDSEIWAADREVGRIVDHLEARGLLDSTIVFVTGDHAEALGEHGVPYHYASTYDSEVRTAGILHVPGLGPRKIDQAVVHQDVMVTVMNMLGARAGFEDLRGRNLAPALRGFRVEPDEFFVELANFGAGARQVSLVRWPFKLIHTLGTQRYKLFHLERDPGELNDVMADFPHHADDMKARVSQHVEGMAAIR